MNDAPARPLASPSATASLLLQAQGLTKSFYDGGREIGVLRDLSFEACTAERIAIVGQSGVGKSTFLHVLGSLEPPTAGKVIFEGQDLFALSARQLAEFRNLKLGFVFQFHYLLADFSALENVMMPGLIARRSPAEIRRAAAQMLELVGLGDKGHRRPAELSGGEQQRVAVARAVVLRPRLVLADEPTGNLDPTTAEEVHVLFEQLSELGITFVVATHNERLASRMHRILLMRDGRLQPYVHGAA
ncbi:MAG TPA: ABC transporter ATP-binding protein [Candidatus Binataceae bacterium]|nr:ABC transporter ATP-binding protein [Candidatus Binataceae bacterium]